MIYSLSALGFLCVRERRSRFATLRRPFLDDDQYRELFMSLRTSGQIDVHLFLSFDAQISRHRLSNVFQLYRTLALDTERVMGAVKGVLVVLMKTRTRVL